MTPAINRCPWATKTPTMQAYHDHEWAVPEYNDQRLFELLCLETYQAGLSWQTVLNKRQAFRQAFFQYDLSQVAALSAEAIDQRLNNPDIIRNRRKLTATVTNAQAVLALPSSFADWLWAFVDGHPIRHQLTDMAQIPAQNALSQQVSHEMKARGFAFVGPTTLYSFLQAAGLINDHLLSCAWAPENRKETP